MNEFLHAHTWMAHADFWDCVTLTMLVMIALVASTIFFCGAYVIIGDGIEAMRERLARKRRVNSYRVGSVCTPEITRAWLAAMNRNSTRSR